MEPGTFNGVTPTLASIKLTAKPQKSFSGSRHVYIRSEWSLTPVVYPPTDNFTTSARLTDVTIVDVEEAIVDPEGPNLSGIFYILLANIATGYAEQEFTGSITAEACGIRDGSGKAMLEWETY